MEKQISLARIFAVFAKIGAFTIGGGYMMVPAIQNEMSKRGWISDEELPDIVATLGSITPPFLIILAIAMLAANFQDSPVVERILRGVRPVSVAIIAAYTLKLSRTNCRNWWQWVIAVATLLLVALLKVSPVWILLTLIVAAVALTAWKERWMRR